MKIIRLSQGAVAVGGVQGTQAGQAAAQAQMQAASDAISKFAESIANSNLQAELANLINANTIDPQIVTDLETYIANNIIPAITRDLMKNINMISSLNNTIITLTKLIPGLPPNQVASLLASSLSKAILNKSDTAMEKNLATKMIQTMAPEIAKEMAIKIQKTRRRYRD